MRISDWSSDVCSSDLGSDQGVLTLALACCRLANLVDRAQQIGGERAAAGADVGGDRHAGGEGDLRTIAQDRSAVQRHPRGVDQSALLLLHRVRPTILEPPRPLADAGDRSEERRLRKEGLTKLRAR